MSELENLTLRQAVTALRERIARNRLVEETARQERERDEAALSTLEHLVGPGGGNGSVAPPSEAVTTDDRPQLLGLAAVREVMRDDQARVWTPRVIHEVLESRGWVSGEAKHPRAGTESAIARLLSKGEIVKVARGRYRWSDGEPHDMGRLLGAEED